jgi:protoporphyrinogen oxidase
LTGERERQKQVVVIGAGPAGLTAAYELTRFNLRPTVLEKSPVVGGLARTENHRGFHFDLGGHRFFTKVEEVKKLWHEVLGEDLIRRPRLSRIYYQRRFFYYPLRAVNAIWGLGLWQGLRIVLSYVKWQLFPYRHEDTFEHWVTNRFGRRLFLIFFKTYTEKVWGISCSELKAEWAAQRIKDLSLRTLFLQMYLKPRKTIRTLVEEFHYPRLGPGMMWRAVQSRVQSRGGVVRLNTDVLRVLRAGCRIERIIVLADGAEEVVCGDEFLSSMPVTEFIMKLDPPPPSTVLAAAKRLRYRDFLTVCLIVNRPDVFPDNWLYIHDPEVRVGRIQNFKNWSRDMVPDSGKSSLGLEYFCTEGDALWCLDDDQLIELAKRELDCVGLVSAAEVEDGCVVRVPKSYPIYDSGYKEALATVRDFVDSLENFHTIGRNGLHRYDNQDHAMLTGMLAVRNVVLGGRHDLWAVNVDQEHHEEIRGEVNPDEAAQVIQKTLTRVFNKLDGIALGLAVGSVTGAALLVATIIQRLAEPRGFTPYLGLLAKYFPGYRVSLAGSLLGLLYGMATGFVTGWGFAVARNTMLSLYLAIAYGRAEKKFLRRLFDYM